MNNQTYIIAEIAQGFEGDYLLCKKFMDLAKKNGADAVKFQIFKADELATPDYQYYDLFRSLEISPEKWIRLIDHANEIGIDFLSDIYGFETLAWIKKTNIKGIKIHSTDIMNYPLLSAVKDTGLMIYLAVGGSLKEEIANALKITGKTNIALLSGFQAEPNLLLDLELGKIKQLTELFGVPTGYADHIDAESELATIIPPLAVMAGAKVIEKHLTIDRQNLQLEDYVSALNPNEFLRMVELIRDIERLPYNDEYILSVRETDYRNRTKRSIILKKPISIGEKLTIEHIALIRTGQKGDFFDINEVVGRAVNKNIYVSNSLRKEDII